MKAIIIIGVIIMVIGFIGLAERLCEIEAHQRVIESMLDELRNRLCNIGGKN